MKKTKKRKLWLTTTSPTRRRRPSGDGMEVILPFTNVDAHFFLSRDGAWKARVVWSAEDGSQKQRYIDAGSLVHKVFTLAVSSRATGNRG